MPLVKDGDGLLVTCERGAGRLGQGEGQVVSCLLPRLLAACASEHPSADI